MTNLRDLARIAELERRVAALEEALSAPAIDDALALQVQAALAAGPTDTPFLRQKKART